MHAVPCTVHGRLEWHFSSMQCLDVGVPTECQVTWYYACKQAKQLGPLNTMALHTGVKWGGRQLDCSSSHHSPRQMDFFFLLMILLQHYHISLFWLN
jgi:hypothetical protein